jgi:hypothetical protein
MIASPIAGLLVLSLHAARVIDLDDGAQRRDGKMGQQERGWVRCVSVHSRIV